MHTATHRWGLRPSTTFALVFTLVSSLSLAAFGQDPDSVEEKKSISAEIQELVEKLDTKRAELDQLTKKVADSSDHAAAVMMESEISERHAEYRRQVAELVELVLQGEDAGVDTATGLQTATTVLEAEADKMEKKLAEQSKEIVGLLDAMATGSPEEANNARDQLIDAIKASSRLVKYLKSNLDQREQLGLDIDADEKAFKKILTARTNVGAGFLTSTKEKIDEVASRPGVESDPEAQRQLAGLRKQRDALADSQRVSADIMDKYGLETATIRRGIISATGKLSDDILNRDVATGLIESWMADGVDWFRSNGAQLLFQLITFLLILLAFWVAARIGRGAVRRGLERSRLDISSLAKEFFIKTTGRVIVLVGFIIAIAQLGVEVGPVLAGLGIAGFVIGFALQDTLSNFASGMMILVYRPFDVGDAIEAGGVTGKVDQMNLVSTMILTFDNQLMIVPNKQVWGGIIRNITHQDNRRVDMTFGIGYSDDIPKAEKVLMDIVTSHEKVLKDPEPVVRLHTLGESSVDFVVRPWSKTDEYWDVYWDITREVKRRFDEEGISIPFPQRDVHIYRDPAAESASSNDDTQRSETTTTAQTPVPDQDDES
jgi:small conductance mechanosensitive channel